MCTASCKQKSPTEQCLLIISKLTQFLEERMKRKSFCPGPGSRLGLGHEIFVNTFPSLYHEVRKANFIVGESLSSSCKSISQGS